jgi:NTE family protein
MDWPSVGSILLRSVVGSAFHELLHETLGGGVIEALTLPFAAVCCDLDTGEPVVLREGSIADAVRASSAIPGILSPLRLGGRNLVDGAVVEPLPIAAAAELGTHRVLAVNVLKPPASRAITPRPLPRPRRKGVRSAVRDRVERWLLRQPRGGTAVRDDAPNRLETVMRSFHVMQYRLAAAAYPDAGAIEPEVGRFGWFDFARVAEIVDEGYRAYRARFPRG